ncbi:DUF2868 domain-containing protein [Stutzerimonas urumqiensis]|uniref:DUF2868 domain-containing protein n=1 Tax=Stutzerimonas urumqiensis TaxID=638269 RepID=UPI000EB378E8|nr:DUF2868 domain-containing protein [Stutzerimonas urumqiensis]
MRNRVPAPQPTPLSPFDRLWLTEAVRLREQHAGPLEDGEANRHARQQGGDAADLIEARALWLARRDGLDQALRHWQQGARLARYLLAALALFIGAGLAYSALGDGVRPVNVFWALGSLLGLNLLTLLGWLAGFVFAGDGNGALGRLWLWLSRLLARDARAAHLAPALLSLLEQRRLSRWLLGSGANSFWLLAMSAALLGLLALMATRQYGFVWETTILGERTFIGLTQALGVVPGLLGFSTPDAGQIAASSGVATPDARHAWAGWLVGVTLVYGWLPRALLTALCGWRWRRGRAALRLDPSLPAYRLLRERLQPSSERLGIADPAPAALHAPASGRQLDGSEGAVLVAIELDPHVSWPPALPAGIADAGVLDEREQRHRLLDQLTRYPPERLAIACDPRRSPDRGTLGLIGELSRCAGQTRVWLLQPLTGQALDSARLGDWHDALDRLGIAHQAAAPLQWLETGHD